MSNRVEEEYKELVNSSSWTQLFQSIARKCFEYSFTCLEAKNPQNKQLNRYRDVNPFDHSRVIVRRCERDYINANFVKNERANRQYILTQGPLPQTVDHFWSMVWEQNTKAIIMLNKIIEKNELKCHWYWPHSTGERRLMILHEIDMMIEQTEEVDFQYYVTRSFRVTDLRTQEIRIITHFHYTTWPDFEVPSSPVAFLEFLYKVRASGALDQAGPAIVHCSAGIGRSGTFCLVDTVLLLIEKEGQADVNIRDILLDMRKYRMGLIQTSEQLRFSYQAIIEGIRRLDPAYVPPAIEDSDYAALPEEEEAPPPPPPRGASLSRPPARPLPAIPTSASLGNLTLRAAAESSDSEDDTPTPPPRDSSSAASSISSAEEDEEPLLSPDEDVPLAELRRRRQRELSARVASMRKRARDAERWQSLKRSLYTPIALSVGFLLAGILIYSYVKH